MNYIDILHELMVLRSETEGDEVPRMNNDMNYVNILYKFIIQICCMNSINMNCMDIILITLHKYIILITLHKYIILITLHEYYIT